VCAFSRVPFACARLSGVGEIQDEEVGAETGGGGRLPYLFALEKNAVAPPLSLVLFERQGGNKSPEAASADFPQEM
jgi:hypothetical protein